MKNRVSFPLINSHRRKSLMYMYRMLLTDNAESGELVTPSTRSHGSRGYNNPISNGIPRELYVRCACISHYLSETELIFYVFSY